MRKALLIAITVLAVNSAALAVASERPLTLLFAGGPEDNEIQVSLADHGSRYVIDSVAPLEVDGDVCSHPEGEENRIVCAATAIAGIEVNGNGGDDSVVIAADVPLPVTLRGGPGRDRLVGGAGDDKLLGAAGPDILVGRGGDDWLNGSSGLDKLVGGTGDDRLIGGGGLDQLYGGGGRNVLSQ